MRLYLARGKRWLLQVVREADGGARLLLLLLLLRERLATVGNIKERRSR